MLKQLTIRVSASTAYEIERRAKEQSISAASVARSIIENGIRDELIASVARQVLRAKLNRPDLIYRDDLHRIFHEQLADYEKKNGVGQKR